MWQKLVGIALLWVALAALVGVGAGRITGGLAQGVAVGGFLAFAAGLHLFAEGVQMQLLKRLDGGIPQRPQL